MWFSTTQNICLIQLLISAWKFTCLDFASLTFFWWINRTVAGTFFATTRQHGRGEFLSLLPTITKRPNNDYCELILRNRIDTEANREVCNMQKKLPAMLWIYFSSSFSCKLPGVAYTETNKVVQRQPCPDTICYIFCPKTILFVWYYLKICATIHENSFFM